jgi:hypothetical protein
MAEQRDAAGYTPGQIRALKIAIAVMTVAIVAGLVVLLLTIVYRAANMKRAGMASAVSAGDLTAYFPGIGSILEAKLPPGMRVVAAAGWGERVLITAEDGSASLLLVLDPKSGRIEPLARLRPAP